MNKLLIKKTKKCGNGLFTTTELKKGQVIMVLGGRRMDVKNVWKEIMSGKIHVDYPLQIGLRTHLILDKLSSSINHSCEPNAALRKNSELFALRDIHPGEEITYDYSLTCSPTDDWSMKCNCGSKHCRKVIGDILTIPKARLEYYKKLGALQTYMKRLLPIIIKKRDALKLYDRNAIIYFTNSEKSHAVRS
jgi:hypothetical protein